MRTTNAQMPTESGEMLNKAGRYLFIVEEIKDGQSCHREKMFSGMGMRASVVHGDESGKKLSAEILDGQMTHSDGGEFCWKRQTAFCVAVNLVSPAEIGKNPEYDEQNAKLALFVADCDFGKKADGNKSEYLDFKGLHFYHIDDPRVKDFVAGMPALEMPGVKRQPESYFAPLLETSNSSKPSEPQFGGL